MNMRPRVARQVAVAVIMVAAVALISFGGSRATIPNVDGWYTDVAKVSWDPPNAVFAPVWSILYVLIAVAGWLIWRNGYREDQSNAARTPLRVFVLQLVLNAAWTPVFFAGYPLMGEAAWWIALAIIAALIVSVVWLAVTAAPWSKLAAWIMVPYLLWLAFAASLNIGIIVLN